LLALGNHLTAGAVLASGTERDDALHNAMQIISAMREWLLVCRGAQRDNAKREQHLSKKT
jgi:hypothetical protein